ncbi:FAD-dependent thymidylate synthase [Eubacteriales bacterium OttesenSCG-928-N14]|nr:FAD-dependent thymidylate synthase [Eubacteriales bacterium OttesenSCG-928-N14]
MARATLKVKLLAATPNAQQIVAMGAKLCYSAANLDDLQQGVEAKDQQKYLEKLVDMGHLSPIEHASFTFGVEGVSRALLAQITRHRIASFSVQSQRYVGKANTADGFDYILPPAIEALGEEAVAEFDAQMRQMHAWYTTWVDRLGNAGQSSNEDARFVLPNASETKMVITMNARELLHFFKLRCCNRAQWEIRDLAWQMLKLAQQQAPYLFAAAGPGCIDGACPEGKMSCGKMAEVRQYRKEL